MEMNNDSLKKQIYLSPTHMGDLELAYVSDAINSSQRVPQGANVEAFEQELKSFTGRKHALALESGTAAIHLALLLLDVQPGDFVICQSNTHVAAANPIRYLHANPVFVDSESDTWNICPDALELALKDNKYNQRIKAIIVVHLYGMPAKMDAILTIAEKYGVPVVEDAAEAMGSALGDRKCGSMGHLSILSFNGNKIITTGGGGALLTNNEELIAKARTLASQANDLMPLVEAGQVGYNYGMSDILAGIGVGQMKVLQQRIAQRRANYDFYYNLLSSYQGISFLPEPPGHFSNRWLTAILVDPAKTNGVTHNDIRLSMEQENIEARLLWKPMHLQPVFNDFSFFGGNIAAGIFEKGLCLPSGSNLTNDDKERISSVLKRALDVHSQ